MTAITANIETLRKHLVTIADKGKSYCITITTLGNLIYILNDGIYLYVLLVPNKKLSVENSNKLLNIDGWKEKFLLTNYHKFYSIDSIDILLSEIEKILLEILNIPNNRNWLFDINPGMMLVKANVMALDAETRRENNKKKANSPLRKLLTVLSYPLQSNLKMSISVTIITMIIFGYKNFSFYSEISLQSVGIAIGSGGLLYLFLRLKYAKK